MRMYIEIRNVNEGASENKLWQSAWPCKFIFALTGLLSYSVKSLQMTWFFFNTQDMARSVVLNFFVNSLKNRLVP